MANAYIPANLDLKQLLSQNPPDFKYDIDNFKYIISLISMIPANNKDILDDSDFVPINAKVLQKRIRTYNDYLNYLVDNNVFETDNHYINGEKSRGYRFTEAYSEPVRVEELTKWSLIKHQNSSNEKARTLSKKYDYLYKWFEGLHIDEKPAVGYLTKQ